MTHYDYVFSLKDNETIVIFSVIPFEDLWKNNGVIVFFQEENYYLLSTGSIFMNMGKLYRLLSEALNNKLQLDKTMSSDLGYSENEYWRKGIKSHKTHLKRYFLWTAREPCNPQFNTWLYNTHDGTIEFAITPRYPWRYKDSKREKNYIPYDVWIQHYKPSVIRTISVQHAEKWRNHAYQLLKQIQNNIITSS